MNEEEYWSCFLAALRKGTSLLEELTRITVSDVMIEPDDWSTTYGVSDLAERFEVGERIIRKWITDGELKAKKVGREYLITAAAIKEMLCYDRGRLKEVPWGKVVNHLPPGSEGFRKDNQLSWEALDYEAYRLMLLHSEKNHER